MIFRAKQIPQSSLEKWSENCFILLVKSFLVWVVLKKKGIVAEAVFLKIEMNNEWNIIFKK